MSRFGSRSTSLRAPLSVPFVDTDQGGRFALKVSFTIFVFLGPFSPDSRAWHHDSCLVGIDGIFANRSINNCENCRHQEERGFLDSDVIPLTTPLIACWRNKQAVGGLRLASL